MPQHEVGLILVSLGVLLVSFDSLAIRLVSVPPWAIIFWRGVSTAIGFGALALLIHGRAAFNLIVRAGLPGVALSCLISAQNLLFVGSITHTTVAHTLVILATAPVVTGILAYVFLRESLPARTWAASLVALLGIVGIVRPNAGASIAVGDLEAFGGSFAFAVMVILLRRAASLEPVPAMAVGGLLTAAAAAPFVTRFTLTLHDASVLSIAGFLVLPISLTLITRGPRYLLAAEVSLVVLLEAVFGPAWVWWIIGEKPTLQEALSGGIVLAALVAHSAMELRRMRRRSNGADPPFG